jgi:hypothetical protein
MYHELSKFQAERQFNLFLNGSGRDTRGSNISRGKIFFLSPNVQVGPGAHTAFHTKRIGEGIP